MPFKATMLVFSLMVRLDQANHTQLLAMAKTRVLYRELVKRFLSV